MKTIRTLINLLSTITIIQSNAEIPKITLFDLENLQDVNVLRDEGGKIGVFQINGFPQSFVRSHEKLLVDAPNCLNKKHVHHSHLDLPKIRMSDGSTRITAASEDGKFPPCLHMESMLAMYDKVDRLVAKMITNAVGEDLSYVTGNEKNPVTLVNSPVKDHVHVYEEANTEESNQDVVGGGFMVPFHADNGMYLILSPFKGNGLFVRLSNGKPVSTSGVGPGSLLVLMGRGLTEWMLQKGGYAESGLFFPVPHAVPKLSVHERTVYARMKIAPDGAIPAKLAMKEGSHMIKRLKSFHEVFVETVEHPGQLCSARMSRMSKDTSSNDAWLRAMDTLCEEGKAYCWMGCMELPEECPDASMAKCYNPKTNVTCRTEEDGPEPMDKGCAWYCKDNSDSRNDFCNDRAAMDMLMGGFEPAGVDNTNNCIILWFKAFTLDTRAKFGVACIGVLVLGIAIEGIVAFRRKFSSNRRTSPHLRAPKSFKTLTSVILFGVNLFLGYLAMLVAMTYSIELFVCVILGLMIGHALFNVKLPVGESIDPCCPPAQEGDETGLIEGCTTLANYRCDGPCTRSFGLDPLENDVASSNIWHTPETPPPGGPNDSTPEVSIKEGGGCCKTAKA